jgi:hypothetical protein
MSASSSLTFSFYRVCLNSFPLFATKIWLYSPKLACSLGSYDFFRFVSSSHCKICLIVPLCPRNPWETLTNSKLKQATFVSTGVEFKNSKFKNLLTWTIHLATYSYFAGIPRQIAEGGLGWKLRLYQFVHGNFQHMWQNISFFASSHDRHDAKYRQN